MRMKRAWLLLVLAPAALAGCGSEDAAPGSAGSSGSGGASAVGGSSGTGGASAVGGSSGSGGITTSAGGTSGASGSGGSGGASGGTAVDSGADVSVLDSARPDTGASDAGDSDAAAALVNPAPGSTFFTGANFWRIDWEGTADFFVSNVDWATVANPWQSQLLADLAPYKVLRFMDWNRTNDNPNPQSVWSTRKQKTQSQANEPIAFEWQIDLCNRAQKDCWFAVPIQGDAAYQKSLAELVKQLLDPRLRAYVEYSNEVWNGAFPQAKIALDTANRLGLPAPGNVCCGPDGDDGIKRGNAYIYGAVRLFEQFESVFGKNSPRLVKVISGQAGWDGPCQVHMVALKNATINPNGTTPTAYAIAPYFNGTSIAALGADLAKTADMTKAHVTCAAKANLPVIAYEGGSDSFAAGNGCTTLQHDPGMYDLYKQYFDAHAGAGMKGPFNQYTHVGACWGLKEKTSDALGVSPKYRGVVDWLAAHP
jgi:hypothetical protein